jgi:hypothetical protein
MGERQRRQHKDRREQVARVLRQEMRQRRQHKDQVVDVYVATIYAEPEIFPATVTVEAA